MDAIRGSVVRLLLVGVLGGALYGASPTVTSTAVTSVDVNSSYSYTLTATDAEGDALTWSVKSGTSLPSGLTLTSGVTVSSLAGSGAAEFADGTGTVARFKSPTGIDIDSNGMLYVADTVNYRIRKMTTEGVVTTLAGGSSSGSVDGTGGAAQFYNPNDLTVDSSGNVYVADKLNNRIRKITPAGEVTTLAGSSYGYADGTGTAAQFASPTGVAVDSSGTVYVADQENNRIRKITSAGVVTTLAGSSYGYADGTGTAAQFNYPHGIAIDSSGTLYVADRDNYRIRKITSAGVVTTLAGSGTQGSADGTGTAAQFSNPSDVAIDSSGNVYVADTDIHKIRKITSAGVVTTLAGSGTQGFVDGTGTAAQFSNPTGVTIDSSGNTYVADQQNHRIRKIVNSTKLSGTPTTAGTYDVNLTVSDGTTETAHNFTLTVKKLEPTVTSTPVTSVNVGSSYSYTLTATDPQNDTLTWSVKSGTTLPSGLGLEILSAYVSRFVGVSSTGGFLDGNASTATIKSPNGLAIDSSGNIYVADTWNHAIRKITPLGIVTTLAGSGTAGYADESGSAAQFNYPMGVTVDSSGNIYVADMANHRIRKITPAGVVTTLAGSGVSGYADGTGSAAKFSSPTGVTVDNSGNVYVADMYNNRIRKITPAGVVTTLAGSSQGTADGTGVAAQFYQPRHLVVDASGTIFVTDLGNHRVRKITAAGVVTTLAGSSSGYVDATGTAAKLSAPEGIALDSNSNLYVVTRGDHRIRKITSAGVVTTIAGTGSSGYADGNGTAASFYNPMGIAVNSQGILYVADNHDSKIRKIATSAILKGTPTSVGTYDINLTVSDGTNVTPHNFTLTVNVVGNTPTNITLSTSTINENVATGTTVGTLNTTDSDSSSFTYSLCGGTDDSLYAISSSALVTAGAINYEVKASHSVCVRTKDSTNLTYDKTFTITVNDIDETDSDGNGITDANEDKTLDTDNDGKKDYVDYDDDNDTINDVDEGTGDIDGDGTPNHKDTDANGNGILDATEGTGDSDGDGIPNYRDMTDNNKAKVAQAFQALTLGLGTNYTDASVRGDITLPTTLNGATVSWSSSAVGVISNAGVVTQQATDTNVTLTATITAGSYTLTKTFPVTVLANTTTDAALATLYSSLVTLESMKGTNESSTVIYKDLTLPTLPSGGSVALSTSPSGIIAANGTVTRPSVDTYVDINATVTVNAQTASQVMRVLVKAAPTTDVQRLAEAKAALSLEDIVGNNPSSDAIIGNLDFNTTSYGGVTYSYTTSDTSVVDTNGSVARAGVDKDVTITVTMTDDSTGKKAFKSFNVTVQGSSDTMRLSHIKSATQASGLYTIGYGRTEDNGTAASDATTRFTAETNATVVTTSDGSRVSTLNRSGEDAKIGSVTTTFGATGAIRNTIEVRNSALASDTAIKLTTIGSDIVDANVTRAIDGNVSIRAAVNATTHANSRSTAQGYVELSIETNATTTAQTTSRVAGSAGIITATGGLYVTTPTIIIDTSGLIDATNGSRAVDVALLSEANGKVKNSLVVQSENNASRVNRINISVASSVKASTVVADPSTVTSTSDALMTTTSQAVGGRVGIIYSGADGRTMTKFVDSDLVSHQNITTVTSYPFSPTDTSDANITLDEVNGTLRFIIETPLNSNIAF